MKRYNVKFLKGYNFLMTRQGAIKILEKYCQYADYYSQKWKASSESYKTPDLKDIARMLGEIMERDSQIIRSAIDEIKPSKRNDLKKQAKPL